MYIILIATPVPSYPQDAGPSSSIADNSSVVSSTVGASERNMKATSLYVHHSHRWLGGRCILKTRLPICTTSSEEPIQWHASRCHCALAWSLRKCVASNLMLVWEEPLFQSTNVSTRTSWIGMFHALPLITMGWCTRGTTLPFRLVRLESSSSADHNGVPLSSISGCLLSAPGTLSPGSPWVIQWVLYLRSSAISFENHTNRYVISWFFFSSCICQWQ